MNKWIILLVAIFAWSDLANADEVVRYEQKLGATIPLEAVFQNEQGQAVSLRSLIKGPTVVVLAYYGCRNLCTWVLNGLVNSMSELSSRKFGLKLGHDYQVITISIDPREKPRLALAKKRSYLARYGISEITHRADVDGWHFLTGTEDSIRKIADAVGFHYRIDPTSGGYSHPSGIVLVSPAGKITKYLLGVKFESDILRGALLGAKAEKTSSFVDEILLLCSNGDPSATKVGAWALRLMRIAGAMSVVALALGLSWLVIKESRV